MEKKNVKEYNDRCGSEADRIFLKKKFPESFRLVSFYDEEDDREFTFLTNNIK